LLVLTLQVQRNKNTRDVKFKTESCAAFSRAADPEAAIKAA
jgi:NifU-like protein involved in Fe-S cluster formation